MDPRKEVKEQMLDDKTVLVTGGTGSFGKKFTEIVLRDYQPKKLIIFSRDELKQHEMRRLFPDTGDSPLRYFIGDVRDRERLYRAFHGVDIVIHAAALKQVPACEYNPFEAIQTNIIGAKNVIDAAIDQGVKKSWRSSPTRQSIPSTFTEPLSFARKNYLYTEIPIPARAAAVSVALATAMWSGAAEV